MSGDAPFEMPAKRNRRGSRDDSALSMSSTAAPPRRMQSRRHSIQGGRRLSIRRSSELAAQAAVLRARGLVDQHRRDSTVQGALLRQKQESKEDEELTESKDRETSENSDRMESIETAEKTKNAEEIDFEEVRQRIENSYWKMVREKKGEIVQDARNKYVVDEEQERKKPSPLKRATSIYRKRPKAKARQHGKRSYKNGDGNDDDDEDDDEVEGHGGGLCHVIPAHSRFRITWDIVMVVLLFYIAMVTPFRLGFDFEAPVFSFGWYFETAIDLFFLFDIFINFRTSFTGPNGKEIYTSREISINYLKTWFALDLISSIPFDFIIQFAVQETGSSSLGNLQAVKVAKGGKAAKTLKLVRVLKLTKLIRLSKSSRLLEKYEDYVSMSRNSFKLVKLSLTTIALAHINACGWGFISRLNDDWVRIGWLADTSDGYYDLVSTDAFNQYASAIYWSISTMTTVGYGDIIPITTAERVYCTIMMIIGGGYYGFIIAQMASLVATWDINRTRLYQEMDKIITYMKVRKFPRPLFSKVRNYYRHFYEKKTALDEQQVLSNLSTSLRKEVVRYLVSDVKGQILRSIPMFSCLDGTHLAQLLTILKPLQSFENDTVVRAGEKGHEMFILMMGRLNVCAPDGTVLTVLNEGACFGELAALGLKDERSATIISTEYSELYSLARDDIFKTFASNPACIDQMIQIAALNLVQYEEEAEEAGVKGGQLGNDDGDDDGDADDDEGGEGGGGGGVKRKEEQEQRQGPDEDLGREVENGRGKGQTSDQNAKESVLNEPKKVNEKEALALAKRNMRSRNDSVMVARHIVEEAASSSNSSSNTNKTDENERRTSFQIAQDAVNNSGRYRRRAGPVMSGLASIPAGTPLQEGESKIILDLQESIRKIAEKLDSVLEERK